MGYVKWLRGFVGHAPVLLAGGSVIVYSEGQVLLQKRADNGHWGFHGGCMELGESTEETARRELREETGLEAGEMEFFGVFSGGEEMHYFYPNGDEVHLVSVVYFCKSFAGALQADETEVKALAWFTVAQLEAMLAAAQIDRVDAVALRELPGFLRKRKNTAPIGE